MPPTGWEFRIHRTEMEGKATRMSEAKDQGAGAVALMGRALMSVIFIWSGYGKLMGAAGTIAYDSVSDTPWCAALSSSANSAAFGA